MNKKGLLLTGLLVYLLFHAIRSELPYGPIRYSLPSLLFLPVALPLIDLIAGWFDASQSRWSEDGRVIFAATLLSAIYFEAFAPHYLGRGDADPVDALALGLGGALYYALVQQKRRSQRNTSNSGGKETVKG